MSERTFRCRSCGQSVFDHKSPCFCRTNPQYGVVEHSLNPQSLSSITVRGISLPPGAEVGDKVVVIFADQLEYLLACVAKLNQRADRVQQVLTEEHFKMSEEDLTNFDRLMRKL